MDEDRAAAARRKIELYREYLAKGVDADTARMYLGEIAELQAVLDEVERHKR